MRKLIILPGATEALGGTLVTLSLLIEGIVQQSKGTELSVMTRTGSLMETYLRAAGHGNCLQMIEAENDRTFIERSLAWIIEQPADHPLLLDNCIARELLGTLIKFSPRLRSSGRKVYFFFHDLGLSYHPIGYWSRKLMFTCLHPVGLCNSRFTAGHVSQFVGEIDGIFYQPVDTSKFKPLEKNAIAKSEPPVALKAILDQGDRIMLTPSRLNKPGIVNDKNLRGLIPVLAHLTQQGHRYHSVIIGEDTSAAGRHKKDLLDAAAAAGVADRFTILNPTFNIEDYYPHADVMVTLAPREPFGRTVVEAIACGTPVIGSRIGGIGEILNHFAPEWTVDPDNAIATAETILAVASSPTTPTCLALGQQWVRDHCSVSTYAKGLLEKTGIIQSIQPQPSTPQSDSVSVAIQ